MYQFRKQDTNHNPNLLMEMRDVNFPNLREVLIGTLKIKLGYNDIESIECISLINFPSLTELYLRIL